MTCGAKTLCGMALALCLGCGPTDATALGTGGAGGAGGGGASGGAGKGGASGKPGKGGTGGAAGKPIAGAPQPGSSWGLGGWWPGGGGAPSSGEAGGSSGAPVGGEAGVGGAAGAGGDPGPCASVVCVPSGTCIAAVCNGATGVCEESPAEVGAGCEGGGTCVGDGVCETHVRGRVRFLQPGGQLTLHQGTETLTMTTGGWFYFPSPAKVGDPFQVTVEGTTPGQRCTVRGGTGKGIVGNSPDVEIVCTAFPPVKWSGFEGGSDFTPAGKPIPLSIHGGPADVLVFLVADIVGGELALFVDGELLVRGKNAYTVTSLSPGDHVVTPMSRATWGTAPKVYSSGGGVLLLSSYPTYVGRESFVVPAGAAGAPGVTVPEDPSGRLAVVLGRDPASTELRGMDLKRPVGGTTASFTLPPASKETRTDVLRFEDMPVASIYGHTSWPVSWTKGWGDFSGGTHVFTTDFTDRLALWKYESSQIALSLGWSATCPPYTSPTLHHFGTGWPPGTSAALLSVAPGSTVVKMPGAASMGAVDILSLPTSDGTGGVGGAGGAGGAPAAGSGGAGGATGTVDEPPPIPWLPSPTCGDGVRDPGEECDGTDMGERTCASVWDGEGVGALWCRPDCTLDVGDCSIAGAQHGSPWPTEDATSSRTRRSAYRGPNTPTVAWTFSDPLMPNLANFVVDNAGVAHVANDWHAWGIGPAGQLGYGIYWGPSGGYAITEKAGVLRCVGWSTPPTSPGPWGQPEVVFLPYQRLAMQSDGYLHFMDVHIDGVYACKRPIFDGLGGLFATGRKLGSVTEEAVLLGVGGGFQVDGLPDLAGALIESPTLSGTIYGPTRSGKRILQTFRAGWSSTGPLSRPETLAGRPRFEPAVAGQAIAVYALDAAVVGYPVSAPVGSEPLWSLAKVVGRPAVGPDGTVYAVEKGVGTHAIDPKTGKVLWTAPAEGTLVVDRRGVVYAGGTAIDGKTGAVFWSVPDLTGISGLAGEGRLVAQAADGSLVCLADP